MKVLAGLCTLALMCSIASAQASNRTAGPFSYDTSKEVTISGTVASVVTKPVPGKIMGAHLMLTTGNGLVDASLGRFAVTGRNAMKLSTGQQVTLTGVTKTIGKQEIFLTRTVKAGGAVYTIRNEHGFPMTQHTRANQTKGEGQ
jgi:hypothetical protein